MTTLYGSFARIDLADGVCVAMADSTTVRVSPSPAPDAERLARAVDRAADDRNAAIVRADAAQRLALATARERDQLISELSVVTRERDGLRVRLDGQAAHRAAGEGVDLGRYVLRADVVAVLDGATHAFECAARFFDTANCTGTRAYRDSAATTRDIAARFRGDLRGEAVEGGEQQGVEGGEGHGATVAPATGCRKSRAGGAL